MNAERSDPVTTNAASTAAKNARTLRFGLIAALGAFGFGFALVPFYDVVCQKVFGIKPQLQATAVGSCSAVDVSREITVEFDASVHADLPWTLDSGKKTVTVHPCELTEVVFVAKNRGAIGMTGQATFDVAPNLASAYLSKTECFCFTRQHLDAGESRVMPVRFQLSDRLPADVNTLTFRYEFNPLATDPVTNRTDAAGSGVSH